MRTYCFHCGSLMSEKPNGTFNQVDGRPLMEDACTNPKCPKYCDQHGGHKYSFWRMKCKNCGISMWTGRR